MSPEPDSFLVIDSMPPRLLMEVPACGTRLRFWTPDKANPANQILAGELDFAEPTFSGNFNESANAFCRAVLLAMPAALAQTPAFLAMKAALLDIQREAANPTQSYTAGPCITCVDRIAELCADALALAEKENPQFPK